MKGLEFFWKPRAVVWQVLLPYQRDADDGNDGTNSLRIPLASSMLFFASFRARRALTSSKPSVTSRLKFCCIVLPVSAESALATAPTATWCLAGRAGTDPSGKLVIWPEVRSFAAFLQYTSTLNSKCCSQTCCNRTAIRLTILSDETSTISDRKTGKMSSCYIKL